MVKYQIKIFAFVVTVLGSAIYQPASAQDGFGSWDWGLELYGWLPDLDINTASGAEIELSISDILENLDFTLQGGVFATKGNWTMFADAVYLNMGLNKSATGRLGPIPVDIEADIDQKAFISTFGAGYKVFQSPSTKINAIGGLRYLHMDLDFEATDGPPDFDIDETADNWDAIFGLQGATKINDDWTFVYYADVGTGDSDYTWQASVGVSYTLENFDLTFRYRYMDFEFDNNAALDELTSYGPQIGIVFRF